MGYNLQLLGALSKLTGAAKASNPVRQGLGAAGGAAQGTAAIGGLTGNPSLANLGGYGSALGTGLGLAGTGYDIYNIATNPNLSTGQKAGHSGIAAGEAIGSIANPWVGLGVGAKAIVDVLRNSGSPQLRGIGNAIGGPALPVEGLLSVIGGDKSPRQAFNDMMLSGRQLPVVGGLMGHIEDLFGFTQPTTGTLFRKQMSGLANQIPELKGFNPNLAPKGGKSYAQFMDPAQYNSYSAEARKAANDIAAKMAPLSPYAKGKTQADYEGQMSRALLGNYGNDITKMAPGVLQRFQPKPPPTSVKPSAGTQPLSLAEQIKNLTNRGR